MPILNLDQVIIPPVVSIDAPTLAVYLAIRDDLIADIATVRDALVALRDIRDFTAAQRDIMASLVAALPPSS